MHLINIATTSKQPMSHKSIHEQYSNDLTLDEIRSIITCRFWQVCSFDGLDVFLFVYLSSVCFVEHNSRTLRQIINKLCIRSTETVNTIDEKVGQETSSTRKKSRSNVEIVITPSFFLKLERRSNAQNVENVLGYLDGILNIQ